MVSLGFLLVFGLAGILITAGVQAVVDALPWVALLVGIGVVVLGVVLLSGRDLSIALPTVSGPLSGRGLRGVFWFGVSYAVASLSCTLPVFLVVVAGTIPQLGFISGVATFLVYGAGMSALLLLITLALAFGKQAVVTRLRRGSAAVGRIAGGILVLAGGYIVFFWASTLSGDGLDQPAAIQWVEQLSARAVNAVAGLAVPIGAVAAVAGLAVVVAGRLAARRERQRGRELMEPTVEHPHAAPARPERKR